MSRVCQITGRGALNGNRVSHSNVKTKRRFYPNLQAKKFYLQEEGIWVSLKVSTKGMRTINKKGLGACLDNAVKKGYMKYITIC